MCPKANRGLSGKSASVVFTRGIISPGCTSVHLSWSFLSLFDVVEQHLLGLHSCPESPAWKLQHLTSALNHHFFSLSISQPHSRMKPHELYWNQSTSTEIFYSADLWWFAFNSWRKKGTKSKSLQTWVGFLNVPIFSVRKSLIKNKAVPCHGCNLNSYLGVFWQINIIQCIHVPLLNVGSCCFYF